MKISIVTVCRNSEKTIEKTIKSVLSQTYQTFEYIIVDGASTDGTLNIVNKYKDKISKIISEPDLGIYDAMNKGIKAATGDYILFLNSDDELNDNLVFKHANHIGNVYKPDLIYGDICFINSENNTENIQKFDKFNMVYLFKNTPSQPSTFYKRDLFNSIGLFSTEFKIVADHEWFLRLFLKNNLGRKIKRFYFPMTITKFYSGGISTSKKNDEAINIERSKMFSMYFGEGEIDFYSFMSKYFRSLTTLPLIDSLFEVK